MSYHRSAAASALDTPRAGGKLARHASRRAPGRLRPASQHHRPNGTEPHRQWDGPGARRTPPVTVSCGRRQRETGWPWTPGPGQTPASPVLRKYHDLPRGCYAIYTLFTRSGERQTHQYGRIMSPPVGFLLYMVSLSQGREYDTHGAKGRKVIPGKYASGACDHRMAQPG